MGVGIGGSWSACDLSLSDEEKAFSPSDNPEI